MKKLILFAVILFAGVSVVNAESSSVEPTDNSKSTLQIHLKPIQTIEVANPLVVIEYSTKDHYEKGNHTEMQNHLNVYSTGGFFVSVNSSSANLKQKDGTGIVESGAILLAKDIKLIATSASETPQITNGEVALYNGTETSAGNTLVESATGGANLVYNVKYTGGTDYINKYLSGANGTTIYETDVLYTITAK